ncbi:hypothetical protein [Desulfosarcina cetonica]|uniref:hypothetical protein n=1 Tax=Desulfosarcina cetonica TaxID=90730 RepID=UPI0006CFF08E|nr:hypothetical protein [Desulfosarcina cetonica]
MPAVIFFLARPETLAIGLQFGKPADRLPAVFSPPPIENIADHGAKGVAEVCRQVDKVGVLYAKSK